MIRAGFLSPVDRTDLIALAKDGSAAHRLARRANALVLLDAGYTFSKVAKVLLLDDGTIRAWHKMFVEDGLEGLTRFEPGGSACQMNDEQQEKLKAWVGSVLPRSTREIGAWIAKEFGFAYAGRSGLIALLNRIGLEYRKPEVISRNLDEDKQRAFIAAYENLLNSLPENEAVLFADAVHPTHVTRARRLLGAAPGKARDRADKRAPAHQHSRRGRSGDRSARMIEALTIDAASTIRLLESIEAMYPTLALIHVFLDNARYHHAKVVSAWLARPERRINLHFIPPYCPHLNPIERLWGVMHKHVTHNKCYATCAEFAETTFGFLREKVPRNWATFRDSVTDNFRVISPAEFRVMR